jgi:hypothetical protein
MFRENVMGIDIGKVRFASGDYRLFRERLYQSLEALSFMLASGRLNQQVHSLGAELELNLADDHGRPCYVNEAVLAAADDPHLTLELNRYNLEYNLPPFGFEGQPLLQSEQLICNQLERLGVVARQFGANLVPIGILPTLRQGDLGPAAMTDRARYRALVRQVTDCRGAHFNIHINGEDPMHYQTSDITVEGANTSFQVHYRVSADRYADTFNAIQLATPLVLTIAGNSPLFFGHKLWHETRIPLFKQSIETRSPGRKGCQGPPRVNFSQGWIRNVMQIFEETVHMYPPLLPLCSDEHPLGMAESGHAPALSELRLHQSSIWLWNRPVYDPAAGGHLRVEMRSLPAGPTPVDMLANTALMIGLAEGLRSEMPHWINRFPFRYARQNFYRTAQFGINAEILWPDRVMGGMVLRSAAGVLAEYLDTARAGLASVGISSEEVDRYMGVIERRLDKRQTGATWQLARLAQLEQTYPRDEALSLMLSQYLRLSQTNTPISEWGF